MCIHIKASILVNIKKSGKHFKYNISNKVRNVFDKWFPCHLYIEEILMNKWTDFWTLSSLNVGKVSHSGTCIGYITKKFKIVKENEEKKMGKI